MADFSDVVNIFGAAPVLTLTDTDPGAKSLKIDVNNNIAQIREKDNTTNSIMSFNLTDNRIGVFTPIQPYYNFSIINTLDGALPDRFFAVHVTGGSVARQNIFGIYSSANAAAGDITDSLICASCAAQTGFMGQGNVTNATAVAATVANFGDPTTGSKITNAHAITVNFPTWDNQPTGRMVNIIGVRVAPRQTRGTERNYGFYYGADAVGSEPPGHFAVYADLDNSFFGGNVGIGMLPSITAIEKLRIMGTNSPDNVIYFGVSGNNMTTMLDLRARNTVGTEIRTLFESSRGGYGSVRVVSNHPLLFSTNNLERAAITNDGRWKYLTPNSAPNNAILLSSQCTAFLDEINNKLKFRVKYSNGVTLKTGEITLV